MHRRSIWTVFASTRTHPARSLIAVGDDKPQPLWPEARSGSRRQSPLPSRPRRNAGGGLLVLTLVALLSFVLTLVVVRNRALECTDVDTTGGPWVPVKIYGGSVHGGAGADRR